MAKYNKMKIAKYGAEAKMFEEFLNSKSYGVSEVTYKKKRINEDGIRFIIKAKQGIEFFFIGEAWLKQMQIFHLQHYAFRIIED